MIEDKKTGQSALSTEEQIKEAAKRVFTRKGYAATRTRDIAEEAGHNLALLNYYFRSKEKLFDIIMLENLQLFISDVMGLINDTNTTLQQKVELLAGHYIDMLIENPGLPAFILHAVNTGPEELVAKVTKAHNLQDTCIARQWAEMAATLTFNLNPIHLLMNFVGLTIFPFAASPIIKNKIGISDEQFNQLMRERKKLIPVWMKAMLVNNTGAA